jgi:hypothetical protein
MSWDMTDGTQRERLVPYGNRKVLKSELHADAATRSVRNDRVSPIKRTRALSQA